MYVGFDLFCIPGLDIELEFRKQMADKEEKVIIEQPTSPLPPAMEQYIGMFKTFQAMGLNPKGDTPEEFEKWIQDYIASKKKKETTAAYIPPPVAPLTMPPDTGVKPKTKPVTTPSYPPKVRSFSGGDNKGDTPYDIWRYDVKIALMDPSYTKEQKEFAIRRSLTGSEARLVIYQGLDKPLEDILETLDSVYGSVDNKEQLLSEFYSARQKEDEDVNTWSSRLEDIVGKGLEKGILQHSEVNTMLHAMLWTGLRQELKDVSGHKYDAIKDFNKLRVALRQIEKDHKPKSSKPNTAKAATTSADKSDIEELKGMVQQLTHKVTTLEEQRYDPARQYYRGNYYRGNRGDRWNSRPPRQSWQQRPPSSFESPQQSWQQPPASSYEPPQPQQQQTQQPSTSRQGDEEIYCRRCGQPGHIQIGCRVRLDHSRRHLNSRKPVRRGR